MNTSSPKERAQKRQDRRTDAPVNSGPCLFSESILQVLATFVFVSGSHGFIHLDGVCFKTNQMNDGHCPIDEQALFDEQRWSLTNEYSSGHVKHSSALSNVNQSLQSVGIQKMSKHDKCIVVSR